MNNNISGKSNCIRSFQRARNTSLFGLKHKVGQKSELNKVTWRSQFPPRANERKLPCVRATLWTAQWCARVLDAHGRRGVDWGGRTVTGRRDARARQWCCEEGCDVTMRMVRWLAGGRARIRVRRVSHLALAILMERLTRSTWGSDARRTGGEWGALSAVSARSVSPLRECEKSNSKLGERTDIEFHLFFNFILFRLFRLGFSQSALVKASHLVSTLVMHEYFRPLEMMSFGWRRNFSRNFFHRCDFFWFVCLFVCLF